MPEQDDHPIRVWRLRQSPPISQQGLAALIGCSNGYVSKIESGQQEPNLYFLRRLVVATRSEIKADDIVWWTRRHCPAAA